MGEYPGAIALAGSAVFQVLIICLLSCLIAPNTLSIVSSTVILADLILTYAELCPAACVLISSLTGNYV